MDRISYRKIIGYKYQTVLDYTIETGIKIPGDIEEPKNNFYVRLKKDGKLLIKAGYVWDGPSGPTIDSKDFMRGSLVHDALYQLMRAGKLAKKHRTDVDKLLKKICKEDGMGVIRSWYVYYGVKFFAKFATRKNKEEVKIYRAP